MPIINVAPPPFASRDTVLIRRLKDFVRYAEVRQLACRILDLQERREDLRALAVLSAYPGEGKTLVCAALAMACADAAGARVLAVDTVTLRRPRSLALAQCLEGAHPLVDFVSLADRENVAVVTEPVSNGRHAMNRDVRVVDAEELPGGALAPSPENDRSLIRRAAQDKQHALVILDTAPLSARNKNNIDPFLVARLSDASLLVTGRKTLDASGLDGLLPALKDPALHLIGTVSNEEWTR